MASVSYQNVTKTFGEVVAVNDLTLQVPDKEFLVLLGPSGCGKTTTLRLLAGLEEVTEGDIYIEDRLVNDVAPKDRDIAMVFQSYALYPHMSVYDNMAFGLKLRKTPKAEIERRVQESAQLLQIEELLDRKPKQLSGGQRQRVAVGRAIVREPAVFLMDEPLSNLDAKLRAQARAELSKLHQRLETTFIYVTHDQMEAMTMGTTIVVMRDGIVQQVDNPQNLYDHPVNIFVGGFIGSPAMNFFDVTIVAENGETVVDGGSFKLPVPPHQKASMAGYVGKQVVLGIRPENIHDRDYAPPIQDPATLTMRVDVTELMGNEIFLYLLSGAKTFIARVDPRSKARVGEDMNVLLDMDATNFFDRDTEKVILAT